MDGKGGQVHENNKNYSEGVSLITSENLEESYKKIIFSSSDAKYTVREDMLNLKGVLIARSGDTINSSSYQKIFQHGLQKPIDEYLEFSNQINNESLLDQMDSAFSSVLSEMSYNFDDTMKTVKKIIHLVKFDTVMLNKLTVYKAGQPEQFDHSLASAFIGVEIGKLLRFSDQDLIDLYCACLLRGIGQMFVDTSLFTKTELTQKEYRAIKVHPIISHLILRESSTRFSDQVLQGVLNHHERLDGSGYPRKLTQPSLGIFERILAVIDTFEAMRRKDRSAHDAMWLLKCFSSKNTVAGEKVQAAYDPAIVAKLEELVNQDSSVEISATKKTALSSHVEALFTSVATINSDIENILEGMDHYLRSDNIKSINDADKKFKVTYLKLSKLKYAVLESSGLTNITFDLISTTQSDLDATRRDIERIAPYMLSQLEVAAQLANDIAKINPKIPARMTRSTYDKAYNLSRLVQQAV